MNVLLVATEVAPPRGGMQSWLGDLVAGLSSLVTVGVVGPAEKNLEALQQLGASRCFPVADMRASTTAAPEVVELAVLSAAHDFQADVVHLAQSGLAFLVPPLADKGIPSIVTVHGNELTRPWLWLCPDRATALRACLASVGRVTAVSAFSAGLARAAGLPEPIVVPNVVDTERYQPGDRRAARRALGLDLERPILLSVARLTKRKGHTDVLGALPALARWNPLCLIIGCGDEEADLQQRRVAFQVEGSSCLLGDIANDELLLYYQAADIFVLPVRESTDERGRDCEGFGIVYLEAAACGLPCVATASGGVPDAIEHGVTGLLVPPEQPDALAAALAQLLDTPNLAADMGRAGRRRVETGFTIAHQARRFHEIYADVCRSSSQAPDQAS